MPSEWGCDWAYERARHERRRAYIEKLIAKGCSQTKAERVAYRKFR